MGREKKEIIKGGKRASGHTYRTCASLLSTFDQNGCPKATFAVIRITLYMSTVSFTVLGTTYCTYCNVRAACASLCRPSAVVAWRAAPQARPTVTVLAGRRPEIVNWNTVHVCTYAKSPNAVRLARSTAVSRVVPVSLLYPDHLLLSIHHFIMRAA